MNEVIKALVEQEQEIGRLREALEEADYKMAAYEQTLEELAKRKVGIDWVCKRAARLTLEWIQEGKRIPIVKRQSENPQNERSI